MMSTRSPALTEFEFDKLPAVSRLLSWMTGSTLSKPTRPTMCILDVGVFLRSRPSQTLESLWELPYLNVSRLSLPVMLRESDTLPLLPHRCRVRSPHYPAKL
jgi:hypothetical protein